eukprot:TRINITY_DN31_c0_g1_i1.p1 TRINITY_DN31_c0_g1~~TRINITY_DN31_c0_g1_i1.p1  ORF type:complete len:149 (+),score=36.01 TRINITY_DN31_c0_g1_i1:23-448(+)
MGVLFWRLSFFTIFLFKHLIMSDDQEPIMNQSKYYSEESLTLQMQEMLATEGYETELRAILHAELINGGWREQLKKHCMEVIRSKSGNSIDSEVLSNEISTFARETFPQDLRINLNKRVREYLSEKNSVETKLDDIQENTN